MKIPSYKLAALIERDANNLDLVRLLAASMVFYGHAFVVQNTPWSLFEQWDPLLRYLHYEGVYTSATAVKVFFFVSGLLVTDSLLRKRSALDFVISRILRIWPALTLVVLGTALVIGPWCSNLGLAEYFQHPAVARYARENILLHANFYLPGVFVTNPHPNEVNLSLWTLAYEVAAYAALLAVFLLGLLRNRIVASLLFVVLLAEPLLPRPFLFPWMQGNPHFTYLPSCFAMGAYLALWKDRFVIGPAAVGGSIALFLLLQATRFGPHAFYAALFLSLLYFSGLPWIRKIRLPADPSYGIYLWGFVIQQVIASHFAEFGVAFIFFASLALAFLIGLLSWHLVEKPAIAAGRQWIRRLKSAA